MAKKEICSSCPSIPDKCPSTSFAKHTPCGGIPWKLVDSSPNRIHPWYPDTFLEACELGQCGQEDTFTCSSKSMLLLSSYAYQLHEECVARLLANTTCSETCSTHRTSGVRPLGRASFLDPRNEPRLSPTLPKAENRIQPPGPGRHPLGGAADVGFQSSRDVSLTENVLIVERCENTVEPRRLLIMCSHPPWPTAAPVFCSPSSTYRYTIFPRTDSTACRDTRSLEIQFLTIRATRCA